jgi:uncharacterized protein
LSKKSSLYLGPEGSPYEGGRLLHNLLLFGRLCHALGMAVTPNGMIEVARALEFIELGRKADVYNTLRAMMVTRQRDLSLFDEAFNLFWQRPVEDWTTLDLKSLGETRRQKKTQFLPPPEASPDDDQSDQAPKPDPSLIAIVPTYSQQETLRYKDFAEMTGEEIAKARALIELLPLSLGTRETRRFKSGKGQSIDLRRSFRQNMRYAGEPLLLPRRRRKIKPRPVVLLCDISGSMERYTRLLLHFTHTLSSSVYQVESFVFSTHLTRITRHLRHKSVDSALKEVGQSVKDWGGGTRTGDTLHTFNYYWARRVLGRGAVVLLISDGWDRGDPDVLRHEVERLQRNCYRLIWLNPLLGSPEYQPLTRGAQALLPHVDDFLPIQNLANLDMLAHELRRVDWRRPERSRTRG